MFHAFKENERGKGCRFTKVARGRDRKGTVGLEDPNNGAYKKGGIDASV